MDLSTSGYTAGNVISASQFLYVYAKQDEYILLGSSNLGNGTGRGNGDVLVYNPRPAGFGPKGNERATVAALTADFSCKTSQLNKGIIDTRANELLGPSSADGTSVVKGYAPCYYKAPTTGIYGVRFTGATVNGATNSATLSPIQVLKDLVAAWDVTVRKTLTDADDVNGRLFTYVWNVYTNGNGSGRQITTDLYYVSNDGYRYKQTLRGLDPNEGVVYANASGFLDTNGAPLYHDYRGNDQYVANGGASQTAGITAQPAQYPLFFSDVTPGSGPVATEVNTVLTALSIPLVPATPQLNNPAFVGNVGGNTSTVSAGGTFTFDTVNTQTYEIVISRDGVDYDPANVLNRVITGIATTGSHSVLWDGKDNDGNPFPAGNYNFKIVGRNGEIHFPMLDIEGNVKGGPTLQKLNGAHDSIVYYDDRGYKAANGTAVGTLNGVLCGGATVGPVPSPTYSLLGIDSVAQLNYRNWAGSNNANKDCTSNVQYFGDAKGLDLWAFEKTEQHINPIIIVEPTPGVDVGTSVSVTSSVIAGDTAYGQFVFTNAGTGSATGVTYAVTLGNPAVPATCPAAVTFTLLPTGVTATYHPAPACNITFTGMPTTLAAGQQLLFNFNYVVAPTNPGPIPVATHITAGNETCTAATGCAPNDANAQTIVAKPIVSVIKSANPAANAHVAVGDTITYTVSVTVDGAPLTDVFSMTDTLGTGLSFGAVSSASPAFTCNGSLTCTLPIGTAIGTYSVTYTATVDSSAGSTVANGVVPTGGGGDNPPSCGPCSVTHDVDKPNVALEKTGPATAAPGGTLTYTLKLTNSGQVATAASVIVEDQLPAGVVATAASGADCGTLPSAAGALLVCTVAGPIAANGGTATFTLTATAPSTPGTINNYAATNPGGSGNPPSDPGAGCNAATTSCANAPTTISTPANVTLEKTGPATATAGSSITYTLKLTNSGSTATGTNLIVKDQLPAGVVATAVSGADCGTLPSAAGALLTCTVPGPVPGNGSVSFQMTATAPSTAGTITNYAATNPDGSGDPPSDPGAGCDAATTSCSNVPTTIDTPANVTLQKTGPATAMAGDSVQYTLTLTNHGSVATGTNLIVKDQLPAGVVATAASGANCGTLPSAAGAMLTCTVPGPVPANGSVSFQVTVTLPSTAGTIVNYAATNPSGGGNPPSDPGTGCDAATTSCANAPTTVSPDFCPAEPGHGGGTSPILSVVNGVQIWAYTPPGTADEHLPIDAAVANDLNALMVDPVKNRALFVQRVGGTSTMLWAYDAANGGWYQALAAAVVTPDFPRGGMTKSGVGYLIAGNNNTPAVWRVDLDPADPAGFMYKLTQLPGTLTYDVNPTNTSSGDIAFDGDDNGWLSAGQDLYRVDMATLQATRQIRPLLGGNPSTINWAGIAFGDDGKLYVADNTASSAYYAYDPATGNLTQMAPAGANGSRDLASCAFPEPPTPELHVAKTLESVNGAAPGTAVYAGDDLVYAITISNTGTGVATLYPDDVAETVPADSTHVAGDDFTCAADTAGSACGNTAAVNVPVGGNVVLHFHVALATPIAGNQIANAVTVPGVDCADASNDCEEITPVGPAVTVQKASNPPSGTTVVAGQTITYTVTATVSNAPLASNLVLTDTLSANQTFVAVTNAGDYSCSGAVQCTLPAGTAPGSYAVTYTAVVNNDASGAVGNNVAAAGGVPPDGPGPVCATPTSCSTTHPVQPQVSVSKTANPADGTTVAAGQTITYTLTATVTNGPTTDSVVLHDTLGAGLTLGAAPAGCVATGQTMTCTLASGAANGPHTFTYTATVAPDASGSVHNGVAIDPAHGGGDPDPVCTSCTTTHPVQPKVSVSKTANPANGTAVAAGQTITYTLTATVANGPTTDSVVLHDTLGAGLTLGAAPAGCLATGQTMTCTLASGAANGPHTFTYTATVAADASGSVHNGVVIDPTHGGGDPNPGCTSCTTTHPVSPKVTVAKTANPASGTAVAAGQTITYTLTATVANGPTTDSVVLHDTLGTGLTLGAAPAGCVATGQTMTCTLASGAANGPHTFTYTATVNADATVSVHNGVAIDPDHGGGDPNPGCTSCTTTHPVSPKVTVAKTANPASGTAVTAGQVITYTLTATVANGPTTDSVVLHDTLGAGLTLGAAPAGCVATGQTMTCTLASGATTGDHTFTYTATVAADAAGSVHNGVVVDPAHNGGDPNPPSCTTATPCTTTHPVSPKVTVAKTANPADGTAVAAGQTITYTLTATVANGPTTDSVVLHDTLGTGLTLGAAPAGCLASGQTMTCTLASGAANGPHTFTYTATVNADATVSVHNGVVVDPTHGGGDPNPGCTSCTTTHPVSPKVTVAKTANPASGTAVAPNDTITYTLTATVANGPTTDSVILTDTLGSGLALGAAPAGCVASGQTMTCTLASGATTGDHTFTYMATVAADATGSVHNSVVVDPAHNGGDPNPPSCTTATPCTTTHPLQADVTIAKALTSESGSVAGVAEPGETLTYTITLTNTGGVDATGYALSDAIPANTTYVSSTPAGTLSGGVLDWTGLTVPKQVGTTPGTLALTVVVQVASPIPAGVTQIANVAYETGTTPPACPGTDPACVSTPTAGTVTIAKALTTESGSMAGIAEPGESLTYTITLTNTGGADVTGYALSDAVPANTTYVSSSDGGALAGAVVNWTGLTVPKQVGGTAGTKTVTVTFQVADPIPANVTSIANIAYHTGSTPPACPGSDPACVVTPTTANVSVTKALSGESITADGIAEPGEELTYTITVRNEGGTATVGTIVNETVPAHTTFVSGAPTWTCAAGAAAGTACDAMVDVPASTGTNPGIATLTFTVKVDDPLDPGVASIVNAVVLNDGTPPDCGVTGTPGCVVSPTANLRMTKTVASVVPTGTASYQVNYAIDIVNVGGAAATYTLTDTLGFPNSGVVFIGNAQVATTGGTINPALPGGQFTPVNGTIEQLSANGVNLAVGATHTYMVSVRVGVQPGSLQDGACTGAAGHGFYNEASLSGTLSLDSAACAPIEGDVPLIRLIKTVTLATDANGNHYGDVADVLGYRFEISNPGTLPLSAVQLFDPRIESLACDPLTANGVAFRVIPGDQIFFGEFNAPPNGTLDPGDSVTCTGTYTLTADDVARRRVVNSATATGNAPGGQAVSSVSTAVFTQFR